MTAINVFIALVLGACGAPGERGQVTTPATQDATSPPSGTPDADPLYSCFGPAYPRSAWSGRNRAEQARQHPGWRVLVKELGGEGPKGWFVLEETDERLAVARERDVVLEPGDDMLRTHDVVSVRLFENDDKWQLEQWSSCTPQLVLDDVGAAGIWLDGEPDPAAATVDVLVVESACAGGDSAEGRVRIVTLKEHDDRVEIVIGVEPKGGAQSCPGNPATPFQLTLAEPIADRRLIDASTYPSRPLQPPPDDLYGGGRP